MNKDYGQPRSRNNEVQIYGKVPPQAPELEKAVLGAVMLESDRLDDVMALIKNPEAFYVDAHQKIYSAIIEVRRRGSRVDHLTVMEQLMKRKELEIIGGIEYLTGISNNVVSSAHIEDHCRIVVEKYMKRELIRICGEFIGKAYDAGEDPFDLINDADNHLVKVLNDTVSNDPVHVSVISKENIVEASERRDKKIIYDGPAFGLKKLEEFLTCHQPGDLEVIGARPSTGKTAFSLQLAINAATHDVNPCPVAIFSLEMPRYQLVQRIQSNVSDVELRDIKRPVNVSQDLFDKFVASDEVVSKMPIYIDDTSRLSMVELTAKTKKLVKKHGVKLVIIDYLQLMEGDNRDSYKGREQEIARISRGLKTLAKELKITIVALSQLNRTSAGRSDNTPRASDLRESGAIEQDADVIILLHRASDAEVKKNPELAGKMMVLIEKNRNGETNNDIRLHFYKKTQRVVDYGPTEQQQIHMPTASMPGENFRPLTKEEKMGVDKLDNDDLPF